MKNQLTLFALILFSLIVCTQSVEAAGALATIEITANPPLGSSPTIEKGKSVEFIAVGKDADGNIVPIPDPGWYSDGVHGTITVDPNDPNKCIYTATAEGADYIQCCDGLPGTGIHGSLDFTVVAGGSGQLARIEVMPENVNLNPEGTHQFTATGYDDSGDTIPISPNWTTTGGSITQDGLYTAPEEEGEYVVKAEEDEVFDLSDIIVSAGPHCSVKIYKYPKRVYTRTEFYIEGGILKSQGQPPGGKPYIWSDRGNGRLIFISKKKRTTNIRTINPTKKENGKKITIQYTCPEKHKTYDSIKLSITTPKYLKFISEVPGPIPPPSQIVHTEDNRRKITKKFTWTSGKFIREQWETEIKVYNSLISYTIYDQHGKPLSDTPIEPVNCRASSKCKAFETIYKKIIYRVKSKLLQTYLEELKLADEWVSQEPKLILKDHIYSYCRTKAFRTFSGEEQFHPHVVNNKVLYTWKQKGKVAINGKAPKARVLEAKLICRFFNVKKDANKLVKQFQLKSVYKVTYVAP